jgi:hypothetical protein
MNLGGLRRRERQAMHELISRGILKRDEFAMADGDGSETVSAPSDLHKRYARHGYVSNLLRRTPVVWQKVSYEYDEYDAYLPSEILALHDFDWDAATERMLAEAGEAQCDS